MKKRNILSNIAKVIAGSFLAVTVLTAISPAMAAYADETMAESSSGDETETKVDESQTEIETTIPESSASGDENQQGQTSGDGTTNTSESRREFPDRSKKGAITVEMVAKVDTVDGKKEDVPMNAGTLELFKVADVTVDNGFKFVFTKDFESIEYDITEEDDCLNETLVKLVEEAIGDNTGKTAPVENGVVVFGKDNKDVKDEDKFELDLGLYLIRQSTGDKAETIGYEPIKSFLVTIPYYGTEKNDKGEFKAEYDVVANVKTSLNKEDELELTPCYTDPPVKKIVTGTGAKAGDEFRFEFKALNSSYPMPKNDDGSEISLSGDTQILKAVVGADLSATVEAGIIKFTKIGDYRYTYREINNELENYKYDTTVYYVTWHIKGGKEGLYIDTIDVVKNDPNGADKTVITPTDKKFDRPDATAFTFTNTYTKPEDPTDPTDPTQPTTRRKQSENTPRERSTVGPPAEAPTVAGAYREPEGGEDAGVLGAARTPQAVLGASRLPQTGQFWWPVPILMICGIALMAGGLVKRRSDE